MRRFWRLLAGLIVVIAVLGGGVSLWLRQSLPTVDGRMRLAGLAAAVEIVRDRHGVPHIFAESRGDASFALGFVHAQDRLWQMEMARRLGAGRLAEVLGLEAVGADKFFRLLDLHRLAAASYEALQGEERALVDAYVKGVNAQLSESGQSLPPEFLLLRHKPEPWTAADSLVWVRLMALDLATNWRDELFRLRLARRLTPGQMAQFDLPYAASAPKGPLAAAAGATAAARDMRLSWPLDDPVADGIGTNVWAVASRLSATDRPLLANDPHLALRTPSIWYFAHLNWIGGNVIGATLPGLPTVVLGRNDRIAWGFANTHSDVQDIYIERLAEGLPESYLTPDGSRPFEVREEVVRVRDAPNVSLRLRRTRHGPVLNDALDDLDGLTRADEVLALAWTALEPRDSTVSAGLRLGLARDWSKFLDALRDFRNPQQNVLYADVDGNIGFVVPGQVPIRSPDHESGGYAAVAGWKEVNDWVGFIPFDELPREFNPARGMLLSANHDITPESYPYHLSFDWADGYRAARIGELLRRRPRHSLESFKAMQRDDISPMARELLPLLLRAEPTSPLAREARALLADWDGAMSQNRPEPLIFHAWYRELARLVYADELGRLFTRTWGDRPRFLIFVLRDGGDAWCDNVQTEVVESCDHILSRSLERAVEWLETHYGAEPSRWRWGTAHRAIGRHLPFSEVPALSWLFETSAPTPGATHTLNVGVPALANADMPFANVHAPSLRVIYDLADLDRSVFIHSTGQSGNPLSPLYDDLVEAWAGGGYIPMTTRRRDIEIGQIGTLELVPRQP